MKLGPAKHKSLLSMEFSTSIKTGLLTKFPHDFRDEQTTADKQYATNGNLVGNPVFIKEDISC